MDDNENVTGISDNATVLEAICRLNAAMVYCDEQGMTWKYYFWQKGYSIGSR